MDSTRAFKLRMKLEDATREARVERATRRQRETASLNVCVAGHRGGCAGFQPSRFSHSLSLQPLRAPRDALRQAMDRFHSTKGRHSGSVRTNAGYNNWQTKATASSGSRRTTTHERRLKFERVATDASGGTFRILSGGIQDQAPPNASVTLGGTGVSPSTAQPLPRPAP